MDQDPFPTSRSAVRKATKARATRNARIRAAAIVTGAVLAVLAVWAVVGAPGLSLVTGDDPGPSAAAAGDGTDGTGASTSGTSSATTSAPTGSPTTSAADKKAQASQPAAQGFSGTDPTLGLGSDGFAPICGGPAPSDKLVVRAVGNSQTGKVTSGTVTLQVTRAAYKSGGVQMLLAEAARASCADPGDPLPDYPKGSVLLRGRGSSSVAYLVTPTSASTALYIKASSTAEDAVVETLFTLVPGLISQAEASSGSLSAGG